MTRLLSALMFFAVLFAVQSASMAFDAGQAGKQQVSDAMFCLNCSVLLERGEGRASYPATGDTDSHHTSSPGCGAIACSAALPLVHAAALSTPRSASVAPMIGQHWPSMFGTPPFRPPRKTAR